MNLSSKFSLYDMLAMVIPGGIIVAGIIVWKDSLKGITVCYCDYQTTIFDSDLIQCTALIVVSYVCGLINNWVCDGLFKGFRNNPTAIKWALIDVLTQHKNSGLECFRGSVYDRSNINTGCLASLCYKTAKACVKICIATIKKALRCCKKTRASTYNYAGDRISGIVCVYYETYYNLLKSNLLGSTTALEGQVALLRNLVIPTMGLGVCFHSDHCITKCMLVAVSLLFSSLLYIVMVQRQQKVYKIVWESKKYCNL